MTRTIQLLAAAAAALVLLAAPARAGHVAPHPTPFHAMTEQQLDRWYGRQAAHDRGAVLWLGRHLDALAAEPRPGGFAATRFVAGVVDRRWRADLRWYRTSLRIVTAHRNLLERRLRAEARAARERAALPAHLALWRCLERGESGGDGVHPGDPAASNGSHFNVLQMTDPWYGISPIGLPYQEVERYAERQYAAAGYSSAWLSGQWGQTIGPCWQYAGAL